MKRCFVALMALFAAAAISISAVASVEKGDAAMKDKRYREAIKQYESYLKKNPNDSAVIVKLAYAYDSAKWFGQAVQWWEKYIDKFEDGKDIIKAKKAAAKDHRWIGANYYNNLGESPELAVQNLERAIELDPKLSDLYIWLARIQLSEGRYGDAVSLLTKGKKALPDDKTIAWMYKTAKGKLDNGGSAYDKYVQGWNLYANGDKDGALERFRAASADNPDFAAAHLWIARILHEKGDFEGAIPEWQAVLKFEPDNARAAWFLKNAQAAASPKKK